MGSISRQISLDLFTKIYANRLETHFKPLLVGKRFTGIQDIEANHYIQADVTIGSETYPIHFRYAGEEDDDAGVETDEDFVKLQDYYNQHIHQKKIENVVVGDADRDEEVYLICYTADGESVDIPLGFETERDRFFPGLAKSVLSWEERDAYDLLRLA
ncbi:hypothetical protein AAGG74_17655 [Bacillus mexicanus]|uniref:hypothetical protein n=1 Tax=Bacillus mexicanus TaxID=2834415 RepID=UPI003D24A10A